MICKNCGEEAKAGRRTCHKCGMPLVDYGIVPDEEEVTDAKELGKRLRMLRPEAKSEKEELDKKREEKRKKREEEEEKKKAAAVFTHKLLSEDEDEEDDEEESEYEDPDFDEDELEENDEESEFDLYDILSGKHSSKKEKDETKKMFDEDGEEYELLDGDEELLDSNSDASNEYDDEYKTLIEIMDDEYEYALSKELFKVKGSISYLNIDGGLNKFNIEDDDLDMECRFLMDDREVYEYEYVSYTKEELLDMLKSMRLGDNVEISGYLSYEEDGAHIHVLTINGPDYYIGE